MALAVPLSRFTPRVGGGSAFFVRQHSHFMASRVTKVVKNPFILGFLISLVCMAASCFYLYHHDYFHNLVLNSSYSGLAPIVTLFLFIFFAYVLIAAKFYSAVFLVGGLVYIIYLRWTKSQKQG